MGELKGKERLGWDIVRQIENLGQVRQKQIMDLDWFGIEVSWPDDEALFAGDLDVAIWGERYLYQRERKILISPLRLRLEDEDLVEEIADHIEEAWDRAVGLRAFDLGIDK
ncbi:hypothetical protein ACS3QZ_20095 (plasmid) [Shimia sp. W99]